MQAPGRPVTRHDPLEGVAADGTIVTGAHHSRIAPAFRAVIGRAVERVSALEGQHALYLYGSVATGMAQPGISDVDLFTIGLAPALAAQTARELSAEFAPLCRAVEVAAAQAADYIGPGDEAHGNRVFLRHYGVHLAGPDLVGELPAFAADAAAARGFNGDIGRCAERWRHAAPQHPDPALLGRNIARKTLLAVAGLVSVQDTTWTTDRIAAAWRWGLRRPHIAHALHELAAWSAPGAVAATPAQVLAALDGVVADVAEDFRRHIGLWQ